MNRNVKFGLQLKISVFVALVVILTSTIFTYFAVDKETKLISKEIINKGMSIGSAFYGIAANNIQNGKFYTLDEGFQTVSKLNKDVQYLMLINKNGKVIVHSDSSKNGTVMNDSITNQMNKSTKPVYRVIKNSNGYKVYDIAIPITVDLEHWGIIRLGLSNAVANAQIQKSRNFILGLAAVVVLLGTILAMLLGKTMTTSIKLLVRKMDQIAAGDLTGEIKLKSMDETELLANSLNKMVINFKNLIAEVKTAGDQITSSSHLLSSHAGQTTEFTAGVADAIEQVAVKNSEQTKDVLYASTAIEQLNSAISKIAASANEQFQLIHTTVSHIHSVADAIKEHTANSEMITEIASNTFDSAKAGMKKVESTVVAMNTIKLKVNETENKLKELSLSSQKIGEITMAIDEIAEQTNLLALNAAIEAARAGEFGKGFAVVADEVRKLAERSGHAVKEIANLISVVQTGVEKSLKAMEEGVREVDAGTNLSKEANFALKDIISQINDVNKFVQQISGSTQHVASQNDKVVNYISSLSEIAEENSASTEEMAASSEQVTNLITGIANAAEMTAKLSEQVHDSKGTMVKTSKELAESSNNLEQLSKTLEIAIGKFTT